MKEWNLWDWLWVSCLWVTFVTTPLIAIGSWQDNYLYGSGCASGLFMFSSFFLILIHKPQGKTDEQK